jgi:hypothetical protein
METAEKCRILYIDMPTFTEALGEQAKMLKKLGTI